MSIINHNNNLDVSCCEHYLRYVELSDIFELSLNRKYPQFKDMKNLLNILHLVTRNSRR